MEIELHDTEEYQTPQNWPLVFTRMVETGELTRTQADTYTELIQTQQPQTPTGVSELDLQVVLKYTKPQIAKQPTTNNTISTTPPFVDNVSTSTILVEKIIGEPMKPHGPGYIEYSAHIRNQKPYTGCVYDLVAIPYLFEYFQSAYTHATIETQSTTTPIQTTQHTHITGPKISVPIQLNISKLPTTFLRIPDNYVEFAKHMHVVGKRNAIAEHNARVVRSVEFFAMHKYGRPWNAITQNERKQIVWEQKRTREQSARNAENKCKHKKLVAQLEQMAAREHVNFRLQRAVYDELADAYFGKPDPLIKCTQCNFDIMCPHTNMLYRTHNREATIKHFGKLVGDQMFVCTICGEFIGHTTQFTESTDGAFGSFVIGETGPKIAKLCGFFLYQYMYTLTYNPREIVTQCIADTAPYIEQYMNKQRVRQMMRKQIHTNADEMLDVVVMAFVISYMIRIIIEYEPIILKTKIDVPETKKGNIVGHMQYFYDVVMKTRGHTITNIMSSEEFAIIIADAYKHIRKIQISLVDRLTKTDECELSSICMYAQYTLTKTAHARPRATLKFQKLSPTIKKLDTAYTKIQQLPMCDASPYRADVMPRIQAEQTVYIHTPKNVHVQSYIKTGAIYDGDGRAHSWRGGVCAVCGAKYTDVVDTDTTHAIYSRAYTESFYNVFTLTCPETGMHDGMPCIKCGMSQEPSHEIATKYRGVYNKINTHVRKHMLEKREPRVWTKVEHDASSHAINAVARKHKIEITRLQNLGITTGFKLREITKGVVDNSTNPKFARTQGNLLYQYIGMYTRFYNMMRNNTIAIHIPEQLMGIINTHLTEANSLPPPEPIDHTCVNLPDSQYAAYMMEQLMNRILTGDTPGLMHVFTAYFVHTILQYDAISARTDLQEADDTDLASDAIAVFSTERGDRVNENIAGMDADMLAVML